MEYNEELYDKEEKDFRQYIRRYPTKEILKWIHSISNDIFDNDKDNIGAKWDKIQLYAKNSRVPITQKIIIQPWFLLDLAYYSIKYGNDFRNKKIERIEEFYELYNYFMSIMNKKEKLFLPKIREDKNRFYLYLFGFAGEQFKYQNMRPFDNLGRDLYIIFELSKNDCKNSVFENIVREEVGVSWKKVIYNLMFAICGYMCCDTLEEIIKNSSFELEENKNDLERVLAYYTASYQEIKDECIERQIFFSKPFIKNQRNEIVTISPYQNLLVFEHCIFWIVRNYYKKKNSQEFINYFGELFEKYFRELLCECLGSDEFEKNKECDRKRADWKIQLGKYKILIEQKSAILSLLVKQQNSQVDEFSNYINKKIKKAIEQLKCTEEDFGDGKYIKIVLLYEDYIKPEALENFYEFEDENDKLIWFVSISEMERLLYLYKMDKNKFIKIMEEKIEAEKSNSKDGKSIEYLLNKYSISNEYLKREKMKYYRECAWESVRKLADCEF